MLVQDRVLLHNRSVLVIAHVLRLNVALARVVTGTREPPLLPPRRRSRETRRREARHRRPLPRKIAPIGALLLISVLRLKERFIMNILAWGQTFVVRLLEEDLFVTPGEVKLALLARMIIDVGINVTVFIVDQRRISTEQWG